MTTPAPINGYCTLANLKDPDVLNVPATATDDQFLCDIITAISRAIDKDTGRSFYKSAAHEARYFTAIDDKELFIGDLVSITAIYTDELDGSRTYPFTWSATDYDLWPYDAATNSEPEPYRFIQVTPKGKYNFPIGLAKGVKVDGVFGWPVVPSPIERACLLWSARTFQRYKTPLGVSAMSELGQMTVKVPPPDPDVRKLIGNYRMVGL